MELLLSSLVPARNRNKQKRKPIRRRLLTFRGGRKAGPTEPTEAVTENFSAGLLKSDSFEFDRFQGPASQLNWVRRFNAQGYNAIERFNSSGARMFQSLASDSLRDATAAALPSEYWEDVWTGLLGKSIAGTIGDAEEERLDYTSISYSALRRSWKARIETRDLTGDFGRGEPTLTSIFSPTQDTWSADLCSLWKAGVATRFLVPARWKAGLRLHCRRLFNSPAQLRLIPLRCVEMTTVLHTSQ